MKRTAIILLASLSALACFCQPGSPQTAIIPEPVKLVANEGYFTLPADCAVEISAGGSFAAISQAVKNQLGIPTGNHLKISTNDATSPVRLVLGKANDILLGDEGYKLVVEPKSVQISANKPAGLYYGLQTLMQLFPN